MSVLDGIFDKIIDIKVAPKILPTNSRVRTHKKASNHLETKETNTVVYLSVPTDHQYLYEISDIQDKDKRSCIIVQGLKDSNSLEVGSWIKRSELDDLIRHNKNIRFIVEAV